MDFRGKLRLTNWKRKSDAVCLQCPIDSGYTMVHLAYKNTQCALHMHLHTHSRDSTTTTTSTKYNMPILN